MCQKTLHLNNQKKHFKSLLHYYCITFNKNQKNKKSITLEITGLCSFYYTFRVWCRWPESNRHGLFNRRILSPVRLPVPPHLHFIFKLVCLTMITIILFCFLFVNTFYKEVFYFLLTNTNHSQIQVILERKSLQLFIENIYYLPLLCQFLVKLLKIIYTFSFLIFIFFISQINPYFILFT